MTPENIEAALRTPWNYTIAHGCYILVEASKCTCRRRAEQSCVGRKRRGAPADSHTRSGIPCFVRKIGEVAERVEEGCLLQITAQALLGQFGSGAEAAAFELIGKGLGHCVASDAHDAKRRP